MSEARSDAEAFVLALCEAFSRTDVAELLGYFAEDAVYEKIPVGRFVGHAEIRGTLEEFFGPGVSVDFEIRHLAGDEDGKRVFVERIIHFQPAAPDRNAGAAPSAKVSLPAMAIFELDATGKVKAWRDYFDRRQAGLD